MDDMINIKLGEKYWCVLKTTLVDETKTEKPEFLVHLSVGYVSSKGLQLDDEGKALPFVEIAGQRVKHTHVFENPDDAIDCAEAMMDQIRNGTAPA